MVCGQRKSHRTRTKQWNPSVMISSITHNCIPAIVCSQHTWLVNKNRLCFYRSSHTFLITVLFPAITHILLSWTISVVLANRKQFIRVNCMTYIAHTLIWLTISVVFSNHKQFIRVNCISYIAHAFIWLPVSFVLPHHKQFIELNRMPLIAHATKIWTMFYASVITNVLHILDGSLTPPFAIIASHIVFEGSLIVVSR